MENMQLNKGMKIYYSKILPSANTYEVCDLSIRTVKDTYFVGTDKHDKHAYLFSYDDIEKTVFFNRQDALDKVLLAEENKPKKNQVEEKYYYEEY